MRLTKSGRLDERYTGGAEGNAVATVFGVLIVLIGWGGYYLYNLFFGEGEETDASLLEEVESAPVEESGGVLEFIDHLATEETILFWCLLGGLFLLGLGMMIRGYRMMKRQKAEELKKKI